MGRKKRKKKKFWTPGSKQVTHTRKYACFHSGTRIKVGGYSVFLGGTRDMKAKHTRGFDFLVPLTGSFPSYYGESYNVISLYLKDYGGVPDGWKEILETSIVPKIKEGKLLFIFCMGGHGRTGTVLASLIALLEPEIKDPIAEARTRYCKRAVETEEQAAGIFAIKNQKLPEIYVDEFHKPSLLSSKIAPVSVKKKCPRCSAVAYMSYLTPGVCVNCAAAGLTAPKHSLTLEERKTQLWEQELEKFSTEEMKLEPNYTCPECGVTNTDESRITPGRCIVCSIEDALEK